MHSSPSIIRRLTPVLAPLIIVLMHSVSHGQGTSYSASFKQNKEPIAVNVLVGQSRVINFDKPVGRFSVSNPEVAEAVLVTPDQVLVNGKGFGQVNFIAWEQSGGEYLVFDVYVRANLSLIDSQMRALFPKDGIPIYLRITNPDFVAGPWNLKGKHKIVGWTALAWIALEIGTSSQPSLPKRTASPLSRSTATT